jgi:hypothetical protein
MAPYFSRTVLRTSVESSSVADEGFEGLSLMTFSCRSQLLDQRLEFSDGFRVDAVTDARRVDLAADQARLLQHLEVLGHGRLGQGQVVDNDAALAVTALDQHAQNGDPGGVGQGLGEPGEPDVA